MSQTTYQLEEKSSRIVASQDGKEVGEITFSSLDEETISIDSTFVEEDYRGGDIARELVRHLVDYAKENNKKVVPVCSYAKKQMESNKEYQEVLKQ